MEKKVNKREYLAFAFVLMAILMLALGVASGTVVQSLYGEKFCLWTESVNTRLEQIQDDVQIDLAYCLNNSDTLWNAGYSIQEERDRYYDAYLNASSVASELQDEYTKCYTQLRECKC